MKRVSSLAGDAILIGFALTGGLLVPWATMGALVPLLEKSGAGTLNYRGRRVVLGLGLVWVAWAIGVFAASALLDLLSRTVWADVLFPPSSATLVRFAPYVLVLGTMAAGMVGDVLGSPAEKGFSGLRASLRFGRVTAGAVELIAIGVLAAVVTLPHALQLSASAGRLGQIFIWGLATLAVALTANMVSLFASQPGPQCRPPWPHVAPSFARRHPGPPRKRLSENTPPGGAGRSRR